MNVYLADETHVAVIEQRPSGVGTSVWVGELRTLDDQPVKAWIDSSLQAQREGRFTTEHGAWETHPCNPISVGASEAEVLALLVARARDIKACAA